jgi:hypothetical protein
MTPSTSLRNKEKAKKTKKQKKQNENKKKKKKVFVSWCFSTNLLSVLEDCAHHRYDVGFSREMRQSEKALQLLQADYDRRSSHKTSYS